MENTFETVMKGREMTRQFFFWVMVSIWGLTLSQPLQAQDEEQEQGVVALSNIALAPFEVALMKKGVLKGMASILVTVELAEKTDYTNISTRIPQIRSDFSIALTSLAKQRFSVNRPIDPDIVAAYLQFYADRRFGKDAIMVYILQATVKPRS